MGDKGLHFCAPLRLGGKDSVYGEVVAVAFERDGKERWHEAGEL
jgi:hypothetical protein